MIRTSILFIVILLMLAMIIGIILSCKSKRSESFRARKLSMADAVVMAVNDSIHYYTYVPQVMKGWEKLGVKPYVYFIGENMPELLKGLVKQLVPPTGVNPVSFAQVSRLLLPATINAKNVMITDVDMLPLPSTYWSKSGGHPTDAFVAMRKKNMRDYMMGWNSASPEVWGKVFDLKDRTLRGVVDKMKDWRSSGVWNDDDWNSDQRILLEKLRDFKNTGGHVVDLNEDIMGASFLQGSVNYDELRAGPLNGKKICYPTQLHDLLTKDNIVTFGPDSDKEASEQYKIIMQRIVEKNYMENQRTN